MLLPECVHGWTSNHFAYQWACAAIPPSPQLLLLSFFPSFPFYFPPFPPLPHFPLLSNAPCCTIGKLKKQVLMTQANPQYMCMYSDLHILNMQSTTYYLMQAMQKMRSINIKYMYVDSSDYIWPTERTCSTMVASKHWRDTHSMQKKYLSNVLITGESNFDKRNGQEMFNWSEVHS